jgi:signal transduction histidine kinase
MAMHKSSELGVVVKILYQELNGLGLTDELSDVEICILDEDTGIATIWQTDLNLTGRVDHLKLPFKEFPLLKKEYDSWKKTKFSDRKNLLIVNEYSGKILKSFIQFLSKIDGWENVILQFRSNQIKKWITNNSYFNYGMLTCQNAQPLSSEGKSILKRFSAVFEQTYTRFLDLQKTENQAREAEIEAALERVRASTMAMQKSEKILEVGALLYTELTKLGITSMTSGITLVDNEGEIDWYYIVDHDGSIRKDPMGIPRDETKTMRSLTASWEKQEHYHLVSLNEKDTITHQTYIAENSINFSLSAGELIAVSPSRLTLQTFNFKQGYLLLVGGEILSKEKIDIAIRFTRVFEQTYTRFLDLQNAEAREKEAIKQASLDRVRAEIASMRTPEDLQHITPLIWRELRSLGVPFFRCGVFIMDEPNETVHMYLSTPSGEPLAALDLDFDEKGLPLVRDAIDNWKTQTVHRTHWSQQQFRKFTKALKNRGLIKDLKVYQQGEKPPESLHLHQVPFKQGMLYVGSAELLTDDQIELVHALADAFSVAYARYEDFVKLEEAKKRVENTLTELKSAQNQLIHAEKMASLGELTAGIAHEIQNPLNFVNNFSEVSGELIDELKEEVVAGNLQEALEIGEDLIQNIEKIHHHGKRASSIVRGMLQHSRAGSDEKVLTDINALADEYLRLAYHGFRAKDKSFKARYRADLDQNLPKIEVVPQDIGRVLLNLINNAFQAVREAPNSEVVVTTRQAVNGIEISVKDNGPGIPADIRDKIFQPFFTTKAAGEGTGLGLSLSYDIVTKGHGGKLKVKTEQGNGSEFVIYLPT